MAGRQTYAQIIGARPATRAEVQRAVQAGILRSETTRAYTLQDGTVISHRSVQEAGARMQYNVRSLEERAEFRRGDGEPHISKPQRTVQSHFARAIRDHPPADMADLKGAPLRVIMRDPRFTEMWANWRANRHASKAERLAFLRAYNLVEYIDGDWTT